MTNPTVEQNRPIIDWLSEVLGPGDFPPRPKETRNFAVNNLALVCPGKWRMTIDVTYYDTGDPLLGIDWYVKTTFQIKDPELLMEAVLKFGGNRTVEFIPYIE